MSYSRRKNTSILFKKSPKLSKNVQFDADADI